MPEWFYLVSPMTLFWRKLRNKLLLIMDFSRVSVNIWVHLLRLPPGRDSRQPVLRVLLLKQFLKKLINLLESGVKLDNPGTTPNVIILLFGWNRWRQAYGTMFVCQFVFVCPFLMTSEPREESWWTWCYVRLPHLFISPLLSATVKFTCDFMRRGRRWFLKHCVEIDISKISYNFRWECVSRSLSILRIQDTLEFKTHPIF